MTIEKDIDVVGKACPLPLIVLAREIRGMGKGRAVRIRGNDPIFQESITEFCREGGHVIVETTREGRTVTITLTV